MNYRSADTWIALQEIRGESFWRGHLTVLMPVMTLYLALAFYQIDNQSLWTDEVVSLNFAISADPISSIWFSSQCPLYYVLLRGWTKIAGTTEFALRTLSTILGAVAICLVYAMGLKLFNRRTAAIAALLLATSPFFVWYSQEVRYINLMLVTSLLATYSFYHAVSGGRLEWWLAYSASAILAVFSFVSVVFLFIAHGSYLLWVRSGRAVLSKWIVCQLAIFTLFTAWFVAQYGPRLGSQLTRPSSSISVRHASGAEKQRVFDLVGTIPYTFFALSTGFSLGPSVAELHVSRSIGTLLHDAPTVISAGVLFASLFGLGLVALRHHPRAGIFLSIWLGVPILSVFLIAAMASFSVYNARYVAVVLPAYLLILAVGTNEFLDAKIGVGLLAGVLLFNGLSLANYYFDPRYARADARGAADYLATVAQPQDILVVAGNTTSLRYYYKESLPMFRADARNSENRRALHKQLFELGKNYERLWLVEIRLWESDPQGKVKATLDQLGRRIEQKKFPGIDIYAFALDR